MTVHNHIAGEYKRQSFDPVPKGTYKVKISNAEITKNKSLTGDVLKITFDVIAGNFEGRKIFDNLNIKHPNNIAVKIAENNLNGILRAVGLSQMADTNNLLNKILMLDVGVKKNEESGKTSNQIYGYDSIKQHAAMIESQSMMPTNEYNNPGTSVDNGEFDDVPF